MSPHPASAATCVLTRATVPGVPAEPAALASTASACLSRTPSSLSAAFFLESGMSNVCHSTARCSLGWAGWAPVLVAPRRTSLRTEG